jgi:hypothetical protein
MSFQAMTWAIEQKTGSPRAKCVLWSIANYAGPLWFAYPKQDLIADESEQSSDSVQRYLSDLVEAGLVRRVKLKRFGRRTHDFLILKPSPLFGAPVDEILPHLPSGCDILGEAENATATGGSVDSEESRAPTDDSGPDATATGGSVSGSTLPPPAVDATALQRQPIEEPVRNLNPTQSPSQAEPLQVGEKEQSAYERFERFKRKYPIKVNDWKAAWPWFKALSEIDQEKAVVAAGRYGPECEKLARRPKDAHKFLRDRIFDGLCDPVPTPLPRGSREWTAVATLHKIAGKENLIFGSKHAVDGGIWYRKPITPQLLALASAKPDREWVALTRQQAGAWNSLLAEHLEIEIWRRLTEGSRAPWPWPPRKDGTISITAPDIGCSDEELADFK